MRKMCSPLFGMLLPAALFAAACSDDSPAYSADPGQDTSEDSTGTPDVTPDQYTDETDTHRADSQAMEL